MTDSATTKAIKDLHNTIKNYGERAKAHYDRIEAEADTALNRLVKSGFTVVAVGIVLALAVIGLVSLIMPDQIHLPPPSGRS